MNLSVSEAPSSSTQISKWITISILARSDRLTCLQVSGVLEISDQSCTTIFAGRKERQKTNKRRRCRRSWRKKSECVTTLRTSRKFTLLARSRPTGHWDRTDSLTTKHSQALMLKSASRSWWMQKQAKARKSKPD